MKRSATVSTVNDLPPEAAHLAGRRVACLLAKLNWMNFDLNILARSCYLQGARDMAEAIIRNPAVVADLATQTPLDWSI